MDTTDVVRLNLIANCISSSNKLDNKAFHVVWVIILKICASIKTVSNIVTNIDITDLSGYLNSLNIDVSEIPEGASYMKVTVTIP